MALIDPPEFVMVPAGLVYGAEDLEREHYKALLQVIGWLWVTKKHGGDLVARVGELAERWGVAERTVYHRLARFAEAGYLRVEYGRGGRVFVRLGDASRSGLETTTTTEQTVEGADSCKQLARNGADDASRLRGGASRLHDLNTPVCSDPLYDPGGSQQTDDSVLARLRELGVEPRRAEALAGDGWVTGDRLERWVRDLRKQGGRIRCLPAVLAANLEAHWEPPGGPVEEAGPERFISGEYAEFVEW